jgi:hypothetical protein
VGPRRDEPKVLDTGRVTLAMRARKTGGARFPFLRADGRRSAGLVLAVALALAALGALSLYLTR